MPVREFLAEAGEVGAVLGMKSLGLVQRQLLLESTVTAYQDCFLLMTALCVVVMPLVFFIRRAPGRSYNRSLPTGKGGKIMLVATIVYAIGGWRRCQSVCCS